MPVKRLENPNNKQNQQNHYLQKYVLGKTKILLQEKWTTEFYGFLEKKSSLRPVSLSQGDMKVRPAETIALGIPYTIYLRNYLGMPGWSHGKPRGAEVRERRWVAAVPIAALATRRSMKLLKFERSIKVLKLSDIRCILRGKEVHII